MHCNVHSSNTIHSIVLLQQYCKQYLQQPRYGSNLTSINRWMDKKMWDVCVYTMEYYLAIKRASLVAQTVRICLQCRRHRSDLWLAKIPWKKEWLPILVLWPGEFHGVYSSSSASAIRVIICISEVADIFHPAILIPTCASSIPAFLMLYSEQKLNKQGDSIQPCVLLSQF